VDGLDDDISSEDGSAQGNDCDVLHCAESVSAIGCPWVRQKSLRVQSRQSRTLGKMSNVFGRSLIFEIIDEGDRGGVVTSLESSENNKQISTIKHL
jgi:hypothetical protein